MNEDRQRTRNHASAGVGWPRNLCPNRRSLRQMPRAARPPGRTHLSLEFSPLHNVPTHRFPDWSIQTEKPTSRVELFFAQADQTVRGTNRFGSRWSHRETRGCTVAWPSRHLIRSLRGTKSFSTAMTDDCVDLGI